MTENIYEIPVGDDGYPPAAGRRAARAAEQAASRVEPAPAAPQPWPGPPLGPAAGYPPPAVSAYDPPAYDPPGLGAPAFAAPAPAFGTPAYDPPAPAFDAAAFGPPDFPAPQPAPEVSGHAPRVGEGQPGSDPALVEVLNAVITSGASDLHISAGTPPMLRVDGALRPVEGSRPWDAALVTRALTSILGERERARFAAELELDFAYTLSSTARFRANYSIQRETMSAAFRIIPTEIKPLSMLGVPEKIGEFAALPRGLVLVTGPTGSGKSTTLAALIDLVNTTRTDHIVTVEDPIEFLHENKRSVVNQREVGQDTHSFQNALKHVLRQDPDVILIGELRDLETIATALTAAETGHLVFATLHTQDAPQSIDRILDVFPPHQQALVRTQLAGVLQGIVSQTLVRRIGGGRAVATEVLVATPAVQNLIREGKVYQIHSTMQAGRELGMHTMDQHLADLVNAGQISHATAYEKAHDLEDLKQLIQRAERAGTGAYGVGGQF
ncbi:MAG: type IV pilus twitching motility protein PilT [Microbacteriaceae bacterium]